MKISIRLLASIVAILFLSACSSDDDDDTATTTALNLLGDTVMMVNTFQDSAITGGVESIFRVAENMAVSDPEIEYSPFGIYDFDITANTLTMTLVAEGPSDLIIPAGRFDRYYLGFASKQITAASLNGTSGLNEFARVTVLPYVST